jgi:hypothetical protein
MGSGKHNVGLDVEAHKHVKELAERTGMNMGEAVALAVSKALHDLGPKKGKAKPAAKSCCRR